MPPSTAAALLSVTRSARPSSATLARVAADYAEAGWAPTVRDGALYHEYSAPSAGPPPWQAYELTPATIYAFGTAEPFGATRWRF